MAGPGHWNDPDMMILGNVTTGAKLHPTRLTPNEQYSHVSLFSLLAIVNLLQQILNGQCLLLVKSQIFNK